MRNLFGLHRRRSSVVWLVLSVWFAPWGELSAQDQKSQQPSPAPKITVSREVTWFTEPQFDDGLVNFIQAVNQVHNKGVTPDNNAVVPFYQAIGPKPEGTRQPDQFFERLGIAPLPDDGKYFVELIKWWKETKQPMPANGVDGVVKQHDQAMARPWKESEFPEIAQWLREMNEPLRLVSVASQRSEYFSPLVTRGGDDKGALVSILLPGVQTSRSVGRALLMRAMRNLGEGKPDEAWRDLFALHRLARLMSRGPTLIEWLVGVAMESMAIDAELRVLSETQGKPQPLADVAKQLRSLPDRSSVADKINIAERALYLDYCVQLALGHITLSELNELAGSPDESVLMKVLQGVVLQSIEWNDVLKSGNRWYDRMTAAVRMTDHRARNESLQKIQNELKELSARPKAVVALQVASGKPGLTALVSDAMIALILPAVQQVVKADQRIIQRTRNLQIALALAAWRQDRGSYPEELSQLAPQYLPQIPTDVFNEQPLRYQRTADGYRFYSVGENETDDQGRSYDDTPQGDDLGVQIPKPAPKVEK